MAHEKDLYYATRLLAGRGTLPPRHSWWARHGASMTRLLVATASSKESERTVARDLMTKTAAEWEALCEPARRAVAKGGRGLMCEHAALERSLVESAAAKDVVALQRAADALEGNAVRQSLIYGRACPGFPELKYVRLVKEHLELYLDSVRAFFDGDMTLFDDCENERKGNTIALVELTAEWF